jgi:hypothetical protein
LAKFSLFLLLAIKLEGYKRNQGQQLRVPKKK